jgi:hypothetical protein
VKQRVLDEIVRVRDVARPSRQPSAGPPLQRFEVPREQAIERFPISARARSIKWKVDSGSLPPISAVPGCTGTGRSSPIGITAPIISDRESARLADKGLVRNSSARRFGQVGM